MHEIPQPKMGVLVPGRSRTSNPRARLPHPAATHRFRSGARQSKVSALLFSLLFISCHRLLDRRATECIETFLTKYSTWTSFLCFIADAPLARLEMWVERQRSVKTLAQPPDESNRNPFQPRTILGDSRNTISLNCRRSSSSTPNQHQ